MSTPLTTTTSTPGLPSPAAPPRRELLAAALASAAVLGAQVLLPRVFSVLLWYHLGFLAVSLALLGYAAGGVLVRRRVRATGRRGGGFSIARLAVLSALTLPLAVLIVVRLPLEPTELLDGWRAPAALLAMGLLLAVPFACLGTLVCALLDRAGDAVATSYAATFLGGAAGAGLTLLAMDHLDPPRVLALLAALPLLVALLLVPVGDQLLRIVSVALVLLLCIEPALLSIDSRKHYPRVPPERVLQEEWNSFSRVTVYENPEHQGLWALPPTYAGRLPDTLGIAIDAWAITPIVRRAPGRDADPVFASYPPTLAYEGAAPGFDALIIGSGGGIDVQAALAAGAAHVTAVEINPLIVEAVRGRFAEFCGDLYGDPRVEVITGEGRAHLQRDPRQYDRIVLSGVDTFAATEAGAFALSENYLYTVEALRELYARLKPGGVLALTRWWFEPPRQTLRLALTADAALRADGVAEPWLSMFIARAELNSVFLLRQGGFTEEQTAALRAACVARGALPVFGRETPSHPYFLRTLTQPDPQAFIDEYPYRIDPTTDDRPFFFEYSRLPTLFRAQGDWIRDRLGGQEVLVLSFGVLLVLCVPLLLLSRGGGATGVAGSSASVAGRSAESATSVRRVLPFALLGFGYLLVELPLMQRLALPLGHPVLAVTVVLVSLLLWSGCGALLAARLPVARRPRALVVVLLLAALVITAQLVGAHAAFVEALVGASQAVRVALVCAFLALPGMLLGMPFPLAVRTLRAGAATSPRPAAASQAVPGTPTASALRPGDDPAQAPDALLLASAFLANGVASVLCGPLAVVLAMEWGFRATLLAGAACYALAALLWWPSAPASPSVPAAPMRPPAPELPTGRAP